MHVTIQWSPLLAVILAGAKLGGLLNQRVGMPAVFGKVLLGLLLGLSLLNLIAPFMSISLEMHAGALLDAQALIAAVLVLGIVGKVVVCGAGALAGGFERRGALAIGVGMVVRGEVALVMLAAGQAASLVENQFLSAMIVMTLLTTLVTPPLLRWTLAPDAHA